MNRDVEMAYKVFNAFNRWLEEDWGFAHENRLYAAPHIAMLDPELAAQELDAVLSRAPRNRPRSSGAGKRPISR